MKRSLWEAEEGRASQATFPEFIAEMTNVSLAAASDLYFLLEYYTYSIPSSNEWRKFISNTILLDLDPILELHEL